MHVPAKRLGYQSCGYNHVLFRDSLGLPVSQTHTSSCGTLAQCMHELSIDDTGSYAGNAPYYSCIPAPPTQKVGSGVVSCSQTLSLGVRVAKRDKGWRARD